MPGKQIKKRSPEKENSKSPIRDKLKTPMRVQSIPVRKSNPSVFFISNKKTVRSKSIGAQLQVTSKLHLNTLLDC